MRIWGSTVSVLFVDASGVGLLKWAAKTEPETNGAAKTDAPQVSKANLVAFMACFWEIPAANASVLTHTRLSRCSLANFWCCGPGQKVFSGPKGRPGRSPGHRGEAPARGWILDHFMPHLHQNASNLPRSLIPKRHESRFFFIRDTVHTRGRCPRSGFVGRRGI